MRRGAKPAKDKVEGKFPAARKSRKSEGTRVHDLEKRLAEALDQQTATSEILRVIASSPTDLQSVLDAMAERAARLCAGYDGVIHRLEGDVLRLVAHHGPIPGAPSGYRQPAIRGTAAGRSVCDGTTVHVVDLQAEVVEFPEGSAIARRFGHRTVLSVPLLREGVAIGAIVVRRTEVRPFSDAQIELLKTFANQAVIAIENVRLFNETKEALERQTATSEILSVISSSPTDVQPVFDAIARNAVTLCGGIRALVLRFDGVMLHIAGHHNMSPDVVDRVDRAFPRRPGRDYPPGRAFLERSVVHVPDLQAATEFAASTARQRGVGSLLAVPLLREQEAVGVISLARDLVGPFSPQQIEVLQTFADQAVIAIENVRLFNELEARNRELTESLEQQTATGEVLKVISRSAFDLQPVLDTLIENAARLCGARRGVILRRDGDSYHGVAFYNASPELVDFIRRHPVTPGRYSITARVALERRTIHVADLQADPEYSYALRDIDPIRTELGVPMFRGDDLLGVIILYKLEVQPFSDKQIELVTTFADQAVIAIENVRLFNETKEALEQQTATSEILRVISQSPTDVQPVFDTIVRNAVRLCDAIYGTVARSDGTLIHSVAQYNLTPEQIQQLQQTFPRPLSGRGAMATAIRTGTVVRVADLEAEPDAVPPDMRVQWRARGVRSVLVVPMLLQQRAIGSINVTHREVGAFTNARVELLKTFADQAVIAIENVRLFKELQTRTHELTRSVDQLTALGEVGQAVSSTLDLDTVLTTIVSRAAELAGTDGGAIYEYDDATEQFRLRAEQGLAGGLVAARREVGIRKGEGAIGRLAVTREPIHIADIAQDGAYQSRLRDVLLGAGIRSLLAVPLLREDRLIGGLVVNRKQPGEFAPEVIALLKTFATQSALAIQNARLFRELADKSHQLEVASQHKSEFLANMSHELRTPLNAIIGFSEVLTERMFGELNEKQDEYLKDIYASGTHLLSLINDILDLSKIEAGRMELELTDFDLPTALDNALTLVRERAGRRRITLQASVDERLGEVRADERKIRQVVLNLLSNAIKFTPEGGRIEVRAAPADGSVEVSVSDTGVGIAPEDQDAVFEEFRQVGTSAAKQEGTGLGLALCRKFVELHGGKIWVQSEVGRGSTFTFTIPVRPESSDRGGALH
jgi:GAF domain-containing protein